MESHAHVASWGTPNNSRRRNSEGVPSRPKGEQRRMQANGNMRHNCENHLRTRKGDTKRREKRHRWRKSDSPVLLANIMDPVMQQINIGKFHFSHFYYFNRAWNVSQQNDVFIVLNGVRNLLWTRWSSFSKRNEHLMLHPHKKICCFITVYYFYLD